MHLPHALTRLATTSILVAGLLLLLPLLPLPQLLLHEGLLTLPSPTIYSSSSASLSAMLKYLSSYTLRSLLEAMTRSQSRT